MTVAAIVVSVGAAVATSLAGVAPGSGDPPGPVGVVGAASAPPRASDRATADAATGAPARQATPSPDPTPPPSPTPAAPATLTGYRSPLPNGRLTLPFGPSRWGSRIVDGAAFHDGIDLATFCGDRIVAAHGGVVLAAGRRYDRFMGWVGDLDPYTKRLDSRKAWSTLPIVVVIDDGNGYRSIYAHFGKVVVEAGDEVRAGQLIGYEGRTGRASGCHLHYGLFSPLETATFGIDPEVVKRMKVPDRQIARIDPLIVLPQHADPTPAPSPDPRPAASTGTGPTASPDSP